MIFTPPPRRRYRELVAGQQVKLWRKIYTPRPWWTRFMEALDRAFWP